MLRQIVISLVVLVVAASAYVYFVPGAAQMLARAGIPLPVEAAATGAAEGPPPGNPPRAAGNQQAQGAGGELPPASRRSGGRPRLVVVTAPVTMARINDRLTAIGEGEAARSVTVMAPSTGTLERLNVRPGDSVTAGTVIGNLDADGEQIAYDRAVLAKQDADAALARTQELVKSSAATTVQLNAAQLAADNAQLELATAELALRKRTIVSPIDGTVGLFQVGPGNAVSPQSVVTTIEDNSHIVVSFWVPERYATAILPGMPVEVAAVAMPGETLEGEVTALDNRIDPASRTLKVQARVGNANGTLRPGMSFQVSLRFPGETFAAVDPLAIQWSSDGAYVWKLMDGKVDRALVEIIQRNSDGVLVKGDLAPGDQVVTQGVQQLTAGASVRLLDGDARPAAREEEVGS